MPALVIRPRGSDIRSSSLVIVELIGGPAESVFPDFSASQTGSYFVRQAEQRNVLTIVPGYMGTSTRTLYPDSDIDLAIRELSRLIGSLERQREGPICIIGSSLGGYLAAILANSHSSIPMLLINPAMSSPTQFQRATLARHGVQLHYGRLRKHEIRNGRAEFVREGMELKRDIHSAFYGPMRNRSLADVLPAGGRNLTLLYSPADDRIGIEEVPRIRQRAAEMPIVETEAVGHALADAENFWAFRPHMDRFIQNCAQGR